MGTASILAQVDRMALDNGMELRLVSAWEILEIRREAEELSTSGLDLGICTNACLLARALEAEGAPLFEGGESLMKALSLEEIGQLVKIWGDFNKRVNPSPSSGDMEALKKNWLCKKLSGFIGRF